VKKGVSEVRPATHATEARPEGSGERGKLRAAVVGEFMALDVAEHRFDGVEVRGVSGASAPS
jgi:hypothetical protein